MQPNNGQGRDRFERDVEGRRTDRGSDRDDQPNFERRYVNLGETQMHYGDRGLSGERHRGYSTDYARQHAHVTYPNSGSPPFVGKGPKSYVRTDERIREDICERLSSGHIDASDIEVLVKDGEVTLSGRVIDRQTKRMAEELIDHISGIKDVANKLKVRAADSAIADSSKDDPEKEPLAPMTTSATHKHLGNN